MTPPASCAERPANVLGRDVTRQLDAWPVDDIHGTRSYCEVETVDGDRVTMLLTATGWKPTIIVRPL